MKSQRPLPNDQRLCNINSGLWGTLKKTPCEKALGFSSLNIEYAKRPHSWQACLKDGDQARYPWADRELVCKLNGT